MSTIVGMPSCTLFSAQMHVLYTRADGLVLDDYYDGDARDWFQQNISQRPSETPAAIGETFALQTEHELHALFRDARNHIIHVYFVDGQGWRWDDLTDMAQAPAASSDPVALVYEKAMQVFYRDARNQIARLRYTGHGAWSYENLSSTLPDVPAAEGRPSVLDYYRQLHLVFRIDGGDLYHLYRDPKAGWRSDRLMREAKGMRPAAGEPFLMATDEELHVLYRDTQDAISHVYYARGWLAEVLDEKVHRAPGAKGDPRGLVYAERMRVFFRSKSDDIFEYYYAGKGKWGKNNLNEQAGDDIGASGDPTAIIYAEQDHVVYRDAQGRVADLYQEGLNGQWTHQVIDDKISDLHKVGMIALQNKGVELKVAQRFMYFDKDGNLKITEATSKPYPAPQSHTSVLSEYGVPHGAEVWLCADVSGGRGSQAHVPCINQRGGKATARFHISGTTQSNNVKFDGVST